MALKIILIIFIFLMILVIIYFNNQKKKLFHYYFRKNEWMRIQENEESTEFAKGNMLAYVFFDNICFLTGSSVDKKQSYGKERGLFFNNISDLEYYLKYGIRKKNATDK